MVIWERNSNRFNKVERIHDRIQIRDYLAVLMKSVLKDTENYILTTTMNISGSLAHGRPGVVLNNNTLGYVFEVTTYR